MQSRRIAMIFSLDSPRGPENASKLHSADNFGHFVQIVGINRPYSVDPHYITRIPLLDKPKRLVLYPPNLFGISIKRKRDIDIPRSGRTLRFRPNIVYRFDPVTGRGPKPSIYIINLNEI